MQHIVTNIEYFDCATEGNSIFTTVKLCTVISTLRWAVLTVLWIGFCHTGPISLCTDFSVFVFVVCV